MKDTTGISDPITKAIIKYENHPSIIKINEAHTITDKFKFSVVSCDDRQKIVNALDISKATAFTVKEITTITNFADDNTLCICDKSIDLVISKLEKDSNNLGQWFKANYFKSNEDKCKLLLNINAEQFILVGKVSIYSSTEAKLLGVTFDSALRFDAHVSKLCKKANQKLHALLRVSMYMNYEERRIIMKSFITSQFGYCPLVWMFHSRGSNDRINKIHEERHSVTRPLLISLRIYIM